jgi:hypothetical protein
MQSRWLVPSGIGVLLLLMLFVVNTNNRQAGREIVRDNTWAVGQGFIDALAEIGGQSILTLLCLGLCVAAIYRMFK